jgi:hypothetical protein
MTPEEILKLSPDKKLKLWLMQNGFPDKDIPKILQYCPQLTQHFTIEQIAIACLTDIKQFIPSKASIMISPLIYSAAQMEVGSNKIASFIEESMAICCSDTLEIYMKDFIKQLQQPFKDAR